MTAIDNTPGNRNFISPHNFGFKLKRAPNVNFFIQKINLPSLFVKNVDVSNEYVTSPYPGEHLTYGPLKIEYMVDEDLFNYLEIYNWLVALGKPESYAQYKAIADIPDYTGESIYSDISLIILNSNKTANYEITFTDAFPISLSDLQFSTTDDTVNYLKVAAEFKYTTFTITSL